MFFLPIFAKLAKKILAIFQYLLTKLIDFSLPDFNFLLVFFDSPILLDVIPDKIKKILAPLFKYDLRGNILSSLKNIFSSPILFFL